MSTRFISTAATFVLVSLLGLGSLFVAVNQPDHGRYAARSPVASPVANTCNVEPLTVDEVIAIVENPYSVIPADFWGTPVPGEETGAVQSQRLLELPYEPAWWMDDSRLLTSGYPTEEDFASATAVADQYLACMANGTFGQIWRLITPEQLQRTILSQFPVYSDEAGVRAYVEENISQSMPRDLAITIFRGDHTYVPNPERNLSRIVYRDSGQPMSGVDYDAALLIGWQVYDTEGNLVAVNDWAGTTIEGDDGLANGTSLTLLRSVSTGQWYVYGLFGMRG